MIIKLMARPRGAHRNDASRREFLELVGRRLTDAREARGLSQRALAREAGLSPDAVSRFESGDRSPTLGTLHDLAVALDLHVAELLIEDSGRDPLQKMRLVLDGQPPQVIEAAEKCAAAVVDAVGTRRP